MPRSIRQIPGMKVKLRGEGLGREEVPAGAGQGPRVEEDRVPHRPDDRDVPLLEQLAEVADDLADPAADVVVQLNRLLDAEAWYSAPAIPP